MDEKEIKRYAKIAVYSFYNKNIVNFTLADWLKARNLLRTNELVKKEHFKLTVGGKNE